MNWRRILALIVALALPAPLVWLTRLAVAPEALPEGEVAPVLGQDRWKHPGYDMPCRRSAECLPPLVCLQRVPAGPGRCRDSECRTDMDCEEGFYCRTVPGMGGGPLNRSCDVDKGDRQEGEPCDERLTARHHSCQRGLRCNGGWCGRRCELDEPTSCPPDFFCRQGLDGPSCVPRCEGGACPEGLECVRQAGGVSVCARAAGEDCWRTPCPEGLKCVTLFARMRQRQVTVSMECVRACAPGASACPAGSYCLEGICRRTCDEDKPESCRWDEACLRWEGEEAALCWPR